MASKVDTSWIEGLWRSRAESILGQIAAGDTHYEEVANLAEHVGEDYHGRFLVELLQNAEDQATRAGRSDATLIIARTAEAIAILNQGSPFDERGIKAVTSAGISPKDAEKSLGNKGIGFKAVFQVSAHPEIYSAASGNSLTGPITAFRLDRAPFDDIRFSTQFQAVLMEVLAAEPSRRKQLEARLGKDGLMKALIAEFRKAAPFKFPKPLDHEAFERWVTRLALPRRLLRDMSTMVVLPTLPGDKAPKVIDAAIDDLVSEVTPGASLLFLEGTARLRIYDRARKRSWLISRDAAEVKRLERGARLLNVRTQAVALSPGMCRRHTAAWRLARRRMGRNGDNAASQSAEREAVKAAASQLPGPNWSKVEAAHAAVALPMALQSSNPVGLLAPDGRVCIGLPTRQRSGTPTWIDGPFHGNVARTAVDFEETDFNKIVFAECLTLFWQTVEEICRTGTKPEKRWLLCAFRLEDGPLAESIEADGALPERRVVLSRSGKDMVAAGGLRVPAPEDAEAVVGLLSNADLEARGFCLPDSWILGNCRSILDALAGDKSIEAPRSAYVARGEADESVIEEAARLNRGRGRRWWTRFLSWLVARFEPNELLELVVLPVSGARLMSPEQAVFFKPIGAQPGGEDEDEAEETVDDFETGLLESLQFFDEECIQVRRKAGSRELTDLARQLSPEAGGGLVRRPRKVELINEVLAPELTRRSDKDSSVRLCASILARAADWLSDMPTQMQARVNRSKILVPAGDGAAPWRWRPAQEVYFGPGWLEEPRSSLIEAAYGHRKEGRLPSWPAFMSWAAATDEQKLAWKARLGAVGVNDLPRLLTEHPRSALFKSYSYSSLSVDGSPACPIPAAAGYWKPYLEYLAARKAGTASGQTFFLDAARWVDGLETPASRAAIMRLVFLHPARYEGALTSTVQRHDRSDAVTKRALWVHAAWQEAWPIVPTGKGYSAPNEAWALGPEERGRRFVDAGLIAVIPDELNRSRALLEAIGVYTTDRAPISRLAKELQRVAKILEGSEGLPDAGIATLVQALYEWLNQRCGITAAGAEELRSLSRAPIPLMRGGDMVAAPLDSAPLFLNDDPQRALRVANFASALSLPISAKGAFEALFEALRALLGPERVKRVSAEPVTIAFEEESSMPKMGFLEAAGVGKPGTDIRRQIAAVIAFGRDQQPMDPSKEAFKRHWECACATQVVFGRFGPGDHTDAFFDDARGDGPTLLVSVDACQELADVLRLGWHLVGVAHQDAFELFALELASGKGEDFFRRKGVREPEWDEIDAVIGLATDQLKQRLRPIGLAAMLHRGTAADVSTFETEWRALEWNASGVASFLGIETGAAARLLTEARRSFREEEQSSLLNLAGVTVQEWQRARKMLGLSLYRFLGTERSFRDACAKLAAAVAVATSRYVKVSTEMARQLSEQVSQLSCPDELAMREVSEPDTLCEALKSAADLIDRKGYGGGLRMLSRGMRNEARRPLAGWADIRLRGAPQREVRRFLDFEERQREAEATAAIEAVMRVAIPLAKIAGETLQPLGLLGGERVGRFTQGWWANPFAALRALHRAMKAFAPITAEKLHGKRAFAAPRSLPDLWAEFPELGPPSQPEAQPVKPPPKKVQVMGEEKPLPEIEVDLGLGSAGVLGSKLVAHASAGADLSALASRRRDPLTEAQGSRGRAGGGGGGRGRDPRMDELVGLLGEILVYEQMRCAGYPDFSYACWVSENRGRYLGGAAQASEAGYDFKYRDVSGKLSGRSNAPLCLIEVKSSAGDGSASFPITLAEWQKAHECHDSGGAMLYMIIRVRNALTSPEIYDLILDPIQHQKDGALGVSSKDLIVRVGAPRP